jgi:hypothetical protein
MFRQFSLRAMPWLAVLFAAFLAPAMGKSPAAGKNKPQLRIVCVSLLNGPQEVVLATRDAREKWHELATTELMASRITDWLPAEAGELHLAVRDGRKLNSIGNFTYPADSTRGVVVWIADPEAKTHSAHFVDPEKANFAKGTFLVFNFTTKPASVIFGPDEQKIEAGRHAVVKPTVEENGMVRMQVTRPVENGQPEVCHDRYVSGGQDSREMIFLIPDGKSGLRVMNLPLFDDLK